jgi:UDP-N-acetylmuramoyl-L-alanyl-D-glutamate--2,6-diaminopimelate ligase
LLKKIDIAVSHADLDAEITDVCHDSRKVKQGNLFVAVRGYESDGHDFIPAAIANGATVILCEEPPEADIPYVVVSDTRRALALVSAEWFGNPAEKLKIIGVTGTKGKTTVTTLLKEVLETITGKPVGLVGTIHNMIGKRSLHTERTTPESRELQELFAQMVEAGCEYCVMEVSSHALVLDRVYGVTFEVGVFTNLTHEHLDFHKTMEEYRRAKSLIFAQSKVGIVNLDDDAAAAIIDEAKCPVRTFAIAHDDADLVAKRIKLQPASVEFLALTTGELRQINLQIPGIFSVCNALAVIATLRALGYGTEQTADALAQCGGVKGRAEVVPTGADFTVVIDYAHTPDSLEKIITAVREGTHGRVITLFGCGGDRDKTKRRIMGEIAVDLSDFTVVTSDNPRTEEPSAIIENILAGMVGVKKASYTVIENRRDAIRWTLEHAKTGDTIILAGKGHETYQEIGKEKLHFDEREVVREVMLDINKQSNKETAQ